MSGNLIDYRINLIKKIGQEQVDWLEGPHEPKRYTIEDLKELAKYYKAELKKLEKIVYTARNTVYSNDLLCGEERVHNSMLLNE